MKKTLILTTLIGSSLLFTACSAMQSKVKNGALQDESSQVVNNQSNEISKLYGSWVEKNPINETEVQGFKLNENLSASSINMETLQYQSWDYKDGQLSLVAKSIGNKVSGVDTIVYKVISVDDTRLVIEENGQQFIFNKQQ